MAEYISREDVEKAISRLFERYPMDWTGGYNWDNGIRRGFILVSKELKTIPSADVIERESLMIYGYPVKELVAFALTCKEMNITDQDLKELCRNVEFAYEVVNRKMEISFAQAISKFCTDKIKIEPEALRREDG